MSLALARLLGVRIRPNGQLANLAVPSVRAASMGEVDLVVVEKSTNNVCLRLRALVMPNLSVPCYGGRTFERDNGIVDDVNRLKVTLHDGLATIDLADQIGELPSPQPPPSLTISAIPSAAPQTSASSPSPPSPPLSNPLADPPALPKDNSTAMLAPKPPSTAVLMKSKANLLPQGLYAIPCDQPQGSKVLVLPPSPPQPLYSAPVWPPQVCDVALGSALYVNTTDSPLYHAKNTHFRVVPMVEEPVTSPLSCPVNLLALTSTPQPSPDSILSQLTINKDIMSPDQLRRLDSLHKKHISAFDEDMSGGFQDDENPYYATFSFRDENRAPPHKVWTPQFNRKCQDLMQSKCDELENAGILRDPSKCSENVRLVSSSFIQQKGSAKHKPLAECSLNEIRFITCFNSLNDSIHPVPGRSSVFNDLLKFMARKPFTIHADLTSSYFQVKVHKKFWKYMGIMTPYRGLRILTRLGQGLLNSDVHLEQVVTRVLGDEMLKDMCVIARDDLIVGGETIEQCLSHWEVILAKLDAHNLKINPRKTRVLLQDAEIYGHRVRDGKVRPSDHIVTSLAATTTDSLVTVKQVNSWKGLYKTLIRHLPNLASLMAPFDAACAAKPSAEKFDWSSPGILAAFNAATKHLDKVMETYLPCPEEQLALKPDTSDTNLCTGWVMYTEREVDKGTVWLPVQYASAKLHKYMSTWTPCEQEGVGTVLAIDQTRHWINESLKPTLVLPDNKPVVEAADLMRRGKHSKNPRLQSFLASVNRSNVIFRHNSAKAGLHVVPDALSRAPPKLCTSKDCQVERFLADLPARVELMPITLESITLATMTPAQLAAVTGEMQDLLGKGTGPIPLGSRETWIALQADCEDCTKFLYCKRLGQVPGRKDRNKAAVNRLLKTCEVVKGLIVSKTFDSILMKETSRVYVPSIFLPAILTVMHMRLVCPLPTQLQRIFEKYFVGFGVQGLCNSIAEECSRCVANKRFPRELDEFSPSSDISHPGSHMGVDVMKRASQIVLVTCDRFSNFATATIARTETRDDMIQAILSTVTPIRHAAKVEVRTDRAPALQSLANKPDPQLVDNGIVVVLGEHANPNSNCSVDKTIRELEEEIKKIHPDGGKLTPGTLSLAVTTLNDRVRGHGLSASQLHFSRDHLTGKNLPIKDSRFKELREARREHHNPISAKAKAPAGAKPPPAKVIKPGQMVYIKGEGTKHSSRDPLLVTSTQGRMITAQKVRRATPGHEGLPKVTPYKLKIDQRFLSTPFKPTASSSKNWREDMYSAPQCKTPPPANTTKATKSDWRVSQPFEDEDLIWIADDEVNLGAGRGNVEMEEGEVGAEDEEVMAEAGGGGEEGGGGDVVQEAVLHMPIPDAMQGPRPRRRPPREQWILRQDALPGQQAAAQPEAPLAPRRKTKPPDFLGIEQDRSDDATQQLDLSPPLAADLLNLPQDLAERMLSSSSESSHFSTPLATPLLTPIETPETSPDTSAVTPPLDRSWLLTPMPCSLTAEERANNPTQRHRHWSFTGPGVYPNHPRFLNWYGEWDPGPQRRWSSAEH